MLLVGAGLLLRSFLRVLDIDLGFEPSHAAAISVDYDDGGNPAKRTAIWQDVTSRALMIPGVESAGISDNLPMSRNRSWGIAAKGEQKPKDGDFLPIFVYIVSPGYLKSMGMRLIEGRDLSWDDLSNNRAVVILNETVARKLWPGQDPIGRTAIAGGADSEVIGVIADVRETGAEDNAGAQMYLPANEAIRPGRLLSRSTVEAAAHCAGNQRHAHAARDQSRAARDGIQTNSAARGPCDFSETILCTAGRNLCLSRTPPGIAGDLWRYLIFRHTANPGNRYPNGARRDTIIGATRRDLEDLAGLRWSASRSE